MKPSEVTISGYVTVKDEDWIVTVKAKVTATTHNGLGEETRDLIAKLKKAGFKSYQHVTPRASTGTVINGPKEKPSATFAWPAPECPVCGKDMKVSQYQKNEELIYYYCPRLIDDGVYCKQCATVSNASGSVNFWEADK